MIISSTRISLVIRALVLVLLVGASIVWISDSRPAVLVMSSFDKLATKQQPQPGKSATGGAIPALDERGRFIEAVLAHEVGRSVNFKMAAAVPGNGVGGSSASGSPGGLASASYYGGVTRNDSSMLAADGGGDPAKDGSPTGLVLTSPIQALCANRTWMPGLIMSCEPAQGGPGRVRDSLLTCIRLAIEAGSELILPTIIRRSRTDIARLTSVPDPKGPLRGERLEYLFDVEHLQTSLAAACPQLRLHGSLDDLADHPTLQKPHKLRPEDFPGRKAPGGLLVEPEQWNPWFRNWLDTRSPPRSRRLPIRVHVEPAPHHCWPVAMDGPEFALEFGRLLRPREDARRLAASILWEMNRLFKWGWRLHDSHQVVGPVHGPLRNDTFIGIHLRTEKDATGHFPSFHEQAVQYLSFAKQSNLSIAYLAYGQTATDVQTLSDRLADNEITAFSKRDLLVAEDLRFLNLMTYDQQALVDGEVMLHAARLTGPSASAFSFSLALRRNTASVHYGQLKDFLAAMKAHKGKNTKEDEKMKDDHDDKIRWMDEWSTLYGDSTPETKAMAGGLWP